MEARALEAEGGSLAQGEAKTELGRGTSEGERRRERREREREKRRKSSSKGIQDVGRKKRSRPERVRSTL